MVTTKLDKLTPQIEGRSLIEELAEFEAATLAEFSDASLTSPRVCALSLTKEELNFVFGDDDEKSYSFSLTRFFWPW